MLLNSVRCLFLCVLILPDALSAHEPLLHEFQFTRGMYSDDFSLGDESGGSWSIDYPKADRLFLYALGRLSTINASEDEYAVKLDDPELLDLPFIYALEVGEMQLEPAEVDGLREYLLAGGFLFIDDFWGSWAWGNLVEQMQQVFPDREIVDIPVTHQIFNLVYEIDEIKQVPNFHNGIAYHRQGITHEDDGKVPHVRGIFDDNDRLIVLINWNSDLGDAWEWADHPEYPSHFSDYAVKLGINTVMYALTH